MITIAQSKLASRLILRSKGAQLFSTFASVNGAPTPAAKLTCSVWDVTFQRGDGVFEVCRIVKDTTNEMSKPRCLSLHLDRLERSANALDLPLPPRRDLEQWIRHAASQGGCPGIVRCMVTRGGGMQGYGHHLGEELKAPSMTFIMWQPLPTQPESVRLLALPAPWHPGGFGGEDFAAIKWLSYGPNIHSTRIAQKRGYDDALLLSRGSDDAPDSDRVVLDGPNWCIAWKRNDGTLCTPSWKELGLLQSTSCTIALQAAKLMGMPVEEGTYTLGDIERHATAAWIMSTTRDVIPVVSIGTIEMTIDPETRYNLLQAMDTIVDEHE